VHGVGVGVTNLMPVSALADRPACVRISAMEVTAPDGATSIQRLPRPCPRRAAFQAQRADIEAQRADVEAQRAVLVGDRYAYRTHVADLALGGHVFLLLGSSVQTVEHRQDHR